jgi:hypothetical protein
MMRVFIKGRLAGGTTEAAAGKGWQVHAHYFERGHITAYVGWLSTKKLGNRPRPAFHRSAVLIAKSILFKCMRE